MLPTDAESKVLRMCGFGDAVAQRGNKVSVAVRSDLDEDGGALTDYAKGRRKQLNWNFKFCGYVEPGALPLFRKVPSRSSVNAC
jgi:hypothetical protein